MSMLKLVGLSAVAVCVAQPAFADHSQNQQQSSSEIRLSKLMDANVVSSSGENLGQLEDIVFNPRTGKIDFAILGRGGLLGISDKYVPVPWKAINVSSEKQFTLNVDKQKLKTAPMTDKQFSNLNEPNEVVTIYRFYEVPMESGAAESPGSSGQGRSSQGSSDSNSSSGHHSESSGEATSGSGSQK